MCHSRVWCVGITGTAKIWGLNIAEIQNVKGVNGKGFPFVHKTQICSKEQKCSLQVSVKVLNSAKQ